MPIIAGIDYSLTSPAVSIVDSMRSSFEDFSFYFFTTEKKQVDNKNHHQYHSSIYPKHPFKDDIERYTFLSTWTLDILRQHSVDFVIMEGFSYGSKGRAVFQIAENAGILKYRITKELKCKFELIPPTVLKKFATGKGNANKELMEEAFVERTKCIQLKDILQQTKKQLNPSSDIIDSYFLCQYGMSIEV